MRPDQQTDVAVPAGPQPWWRMPFRMVQTNLKLTDALIDPQRVARGAREIGANVLLTNVGGIYAFYPTDLPLQERNPFMRGDYLGETLQAARAEGLKLVGRFDMSKGTRRAYETHPEWFMHNREGRPIVYNGTYQACVNGGWYQIYAHEILREAVGRYDVDGLFFNMFGYRTRDYSDTYHGICACGNCRRRFREMSGRDLPQCESFDDPAYRDYLAFQEATTRQLADDIYRTIKSVNPDVAVTGHRNTADLIRMEVQRAVDRAQPEWPYQAGEQARWAAAFGRGKTFASTSANFIDFAWRFVAETGPYHMLRFAQQLASGAALDYYLLGTFDQEDKKPFGHVRRLFAWHAANEGHYRDLVSAARIGLYQSHKTETHRGATRTAAEGNSCFRGMYRALVEARLPFDFVSDERLGDADAATELARYDVIVMPNVACIGDHEAETLDAYVAAGGTIVATGETGAYDERGVLRDRLALKSLPVSEIAFVRKDMRGSYFRIARDTLDFPDTELIYLDGKYFDAVPVEGAETLLALMPPQRFGPPELCYLEEGAGNPGGFFGRHGRGNAAYLPWLPEWLYYRDSLPDHRSLLVQVIGRLAPPPPVSLAGPGPVEITVHRQPGEGRLLVHLVNYSGQRNNLYEEPVPIHGLRLGIRGMVVEAARGLVAAADLDVGAAPGPDADGYIWLDLPPLRVFEAVSIVGR